MSVNVRFGSETSGFHKGVDQLQNRVRKFSGEVRGLMMRAFAVGAIIARLRSINQELDRIGKLSRGGISTDWLQDMSLVAERSGSSLEAVVKAVRRLNGEVNRAGGPSAQMTAELEAIGLSVKDLQTMAPEKLFQHVADAIGGLADDSDRAAALTNIFGQRMADLEPLMESLYSERMPEAAKVTEEVIRQNEAMNDSMANINNQINANLAPVLTILTGIVAVLGRTFKWFADIAGAYMAAWVATVSRGASKVTNVLKLVRDSFTNLGNLIRAVFSFDREEIRKALRQAVDDVGTAFDEFDRRGEQASDRFKSSLQSAGEVMRDATAEASRDLGRLWKDMGAGVGVGSGTGASRPGPRERTGVRVADDDEAAANGEQVRQLERTEKGLIDALEKMRDAFTDPRNIGVSSLQQIGGGGVANVSDSDFFKKAEKEKLSLLEQIRDEIADAKGGTIK